MLVIYILVFFLGACFGSFYHVVGYRMPIGENWVKDRSRCPGCSHELQFYELIPVFSYLVQGGKCRICHMKIKLIYLLSEIIAGLLFVFPVAIYGFEGLEDGRVYLIWTVLSMLIIVTVSEIYYQVFLDKAIFFFAGVLILLYGVFSPQNILLGLIGAGVGFLILYAVDLLSLPTFTQEHFSEKYAKLYIVIGFLLGVFNTLLSFFLAFSIYEIFNLLFQKSKVKPISLGVFITMISYLYLLLKFII